MSLGRWDFSEKRDVDNMAESKYSIVVTAMNNPAMAQFFAEFPQIKRHFLDDEYSLPYLLSTGKESKTPRPLLAKIVSHCLGLLKKKDDTSVSWDECVSIVCMIILVYWKQNLPLTHVYGAAYERQATQIANNDQSFTEWMMSMFGATAFSKVYTVIVDNYTDPVISKIYQLKNAVDENGVTVLPNNGKAPSSFPWGTVGIISAGIIGIYLFSKKKKGKRKK